jgi:NAD(P)-dependent dehydrogenase (short-subunit alcohol dehydrogenase family)
MRISGSTFLITGGGSGLGAATAEALRAAGANVVILDVNEEAGKSVAARLGPGALFIVSDVTSEDSVLNALAIAKQRFGAMHGAMNCAGIAIGERVVGKNGPHSLERFSRVIQTNLVGTFNVARLAAAAMSANEPDQSTGERGVIVMTASVAAFDGQVGQAAYAASKGGVAAMTLPLARDLAQHAIRVVTIAPGLFDTPMLQGLPESARVSLGQQVPFPSRLGRPSEYANLVLHIVENTMLNGEVIRLDGALRMAPR